MSKKEMILETLMKTAKTKALKNRTYEILETGNVNVKLAPQAVKCLAVLFGMNKAKVTEVEIQDAMEASDLVTKQTKYGVFKFYKKDIMEAGFLKEIVTAPVANSKK